MNRGFTLIEVLIAPVIGGVGALRGQVGDAAAIAANILWSVSPVGGDVIVAKDSTIEVHATIGSAVVCESASGRVTIPAASSSPGNTLSAFLTLPDEGD